VSFPSVLVLGLGNDILTDDAVGLRIVEVLRDRFADEPDIELKSTTEMGLTLLDEIADRASLVLVDSVQTGKMPAGHVHEMDPAELSGVLTTAPHFLGVRETLVLGNLLGLPMPRQVRIVAVEVADPFTLGTELTPAVAAAVNVAADRVATLARAMAISATSAPA